MRRSILVLAALALLAARARAHVAPSPDVNNRYAKVMLLRDGVRVAFTVFFGERPGSAERRRMDLDGDGKIDVAEARAFGERMRREIAESVTVDVDGRRIADWTLEDVGMGVVGPGAGTFSIDVVLRAPLGELAEHTFRLEDRLMLPAPGEEQLRVEESPGVRVTQSYLEPDSRGLRTTFDFTGNPGPSRAIGVRFTVEAALRPASAPSWLWLVASAGAISAVGVAVWAVRKRRGR
ncbi:MAG TPA: hypothetical protein VKE22_24615 [Haliangiales bacterium]|nr:hypothetical protein [Haliangiales bacterium]